MRLHYYKYSLSRGRQKIKTKAGTIISAAVIAVSGGVGLSLVMFGGAHAATPSWNLNPSPIVFNCGGTDYSHAFNTVNEDQATGNFTGTGSYSSDSSYTWNATGNISGSSITFQIVYTGSDPGYTLNGVGTISGDGSVSGTVDNNCQTFTMPAGSASLINVTSSQVNVTPTNMHGWLFIDDQNNSTATATGEMVSGPATPPLGVGSAQLSVSGVNDGQALLTPNYAGTPLSSLTNLRYSSYQTGPTLAIALSFDIKYAPSATGYQGRLVFEPYQNGAVTVGSGWQTWNPLQGKWWASKTTSAGSSGQCPQANPCSWSQVMANWPNASILGNVVFKAGSGWNAFTGNVDAFTIGINNTSTTYNFDPYEVPSTTDQCKNGGWQSLNANDGSSFKNQGACVSYVASDGRSEH